MFQEAKLCRFSASSGRGRLAAWIYATVRSVVLPYAAFVVS